MLLQMGSSVDVVVLVGPPAGLEAAQQELLSEGALLFLRELVQEFDTEVEELFASRLRSRARYRAGKALPEMMDSPERRDPTWRIAPLPPRLRCRHIDIGDVSPASAAHLAEALRCGAQGVQVDLDDGHCASWRNQVQGLHNILLAVQGRLLGAPALPACPLLMLRPRAWNIIEHNILVNGKAVPGALVDFALLMFHCAGALAAQGAGPFLYLSKLEGAAEARLWDSLFRAVQRRLDIPLGTIKACVLIENALAVFETHEILYALREHSLGLNCGIWDYIASMISNFGDRPDFLLPDRQKYLSPQNEFLQEYLRTVVSACRARGAPATGGMAAALLPPQQGEECTQIINKVIEAKSKEIQAGVDGFLIYDIRLVPHISELWKQSGACGVSPSGLCAPRAAALLRMPPGGHTLAGLRHSAAVSVLYVFHWLGGRGHFFHGGCVEDSATAEISRWQVWQCIRHQVVLEDGPQVTFSLVERLTQEFCSRSERSLCRSTAESKRLRTAKTVSLQIFSARHPPDFLTTHLGTELRWVHQHSRL